MPWRATTTRGRSVARRDARPAKSRLPTVLRTYQGAQATDVGRENHGRDARATKPPVGGRASDEGRATRPPAETLHASPFTLHDASCKTKPISPGGRSRPSSLRRRSCGELASQEACETKPIRRAQGACRGYAGDRDAGLRGWVRLHFVGAACTHGMRNPSRQESCH